MSILKLVRRHVFGRAARRLSTSFTDVTPNIALSRWAFVLMMIRVGQLVSLQNFKPYGDLLLAKYHYFLSLTRPVNWISTSEAFERMEIIFITYLLIMCFLQLVLIRNALKEQTDQSMKLLVIVYKNMGKIFDFLLFIPIVEVLCVTTNTTTSVQMITSTAKALKLPLLILLSVVSVLYFVGELFDVPLKTRASNHLLGSTRFLDLIRTIMSIPLVVIAAQTNNQFAIGIPASIYAFILILLGIMCRTYRNKTSRRIFLMLSAYYFIHSFTLLFIDLQKNEKNKMYAISNTFSLFLFLALPLGMKLSLVIDHLITSKVRFGETGLLNDLIQRKERELLSEILNAKNGGKINFNANGQLEILISNHLNSCKDTSCFCNTWSLYKTEDMNKIEDLRIEFIENYYEKLLTHNQSKQIDTLIELVLFQAFYLDRPFKACFTWSRFRSMFRSFDQRFILDSLLRLVEESYLESLSKSELEFQKIEFHRGITFESDYGKVLDSIEIVRKAHCEFYQYLVDSRVASTDKIYSLGSAVQKSLEDAKQKAEELTKTYTDSPEAMVLYFNFSKELLYASSESTKRIEAIISHLYAKKHERQANSRFNPLSSQFKRFDYFDAKNIFLKIDPSSINGIIRNYNSVLLSDLGIERDLTVKAEMTLKTILPRGIRDEVSKTLGFISTNLSSQAALGHYLSPVFLSHVTEVLLPYKASLKIEFDEDGVFGAAVLQKLRSNFQYILTKPSGEIISLTQGLLNCFELQHVNQVQGLNICFLIPKLFKYYLTADQLDNSVSFPHDGIYTNYFSATACLSNEYLTKYNKTARAEVEQAIRGLDELNNLQIGQELERSQIESIINNYVEATQKIDLPFEGSRKLTLRVQKYEYHCSRFRVIEIYSFKNASKNPITRTNKFFSSEEGSGVIKSIDLMEESRGARQKTDYPQLRSEKSTFFPRDQTPQNIQLSSAEDIAFEAENGTGYTLNFLSSPKSNVALQRNGSNDMTYKLFNVMQEKDEDDDEDNVKILSWQERRQHSLRTTEKLEIEKKKVKAAKKPNKKEGLFHKQFFNSGSSQGSTTTSVLDRHSTQSLIERDISYRMLQVFLVLGLLGISLIFVLFSVQCMDAKTRLQTLGELSRSTGYPLLNSVYLNYIARNAYQWELQVKGFLPIGPMMMPVFVGQVVILTNVNSIGNLRNMSLAGNLNEMLYERMQSPAHGVKIDFPNGTAVNMSLVLASTVLFKASDDYTKKRIQAGLNTPRTQMEFVLMSNTTFVPAEMSLQIGIELTNQIHSEIKSNLDLNTKIIGIIAMLIALIGVGFLLVYRRIVHKRGQMLGLFCRVSKNELLTAWERMSGLQVSSQGGKKSTYSGIIRTKERQKERIVLAYHSNSRIKYMGFAFLLIVGVFMIPFLIVYIWIKDRLYIWELTIDQVTSWGIIQAKMSALMRVSYEYYYSLQGNISNVEVLEQRKDTIMQEYGEMLETLQEFFSKFGNLPNQDIYNETTTAQINGGKLNLCPYLESDAQTTMFCMTQTFGVASQGAIPTLDYVRRGIASDWYQVSQSKTPIQTMLKLAQPIFMTGNFQIIINRFFFITGNMMKGTLNDYITGVSNTLIVLYCSISVGIIIVFGVFWILFLIRMQKWLNKSKSLLKILPPNILKTHPFIRNYLVKELKYSSG